MYLPADVFSRIKSACETLIDEYGRTSPYRQKILGSQLAGLLFQIKELLLSFQVKVETMKRPAEIARRFRSALNQSFLRILRKEEKHIWSVHDYADSLHIHPNHLSATIKSETGKTVKQWIDGKIIAEANAMLKNTTMTVAEIAYELTFGDPSNFSRYYKNITGQTPAQYRNS
jgi:AraC-like DNA-binding protein